MIGNAGLRTVASLLDLGHEGVEAIVLTITDVLAAPQARHVATTMPVLRLVVPEASAATAGSRLRSLV